MLLAPLLLLCALPQDAEELTRKGIAELRQVEADVAAGKVTGLDIAGAFFGAAISLREACEAGGAPAEAFEAWSEALLNADSLKQSLEAVEGGLKDHPKALILHLQHGRVLTAQAGKAGGNKQKELWTRAGEVYAAAMKMDRKAVPACLRQGEIQVYLGEMEAAKDAWAEALKRDAAQVDLGAMVSWLPQPQAAALIDQLKQGPGADQALLSWYRGLAAYNTLSRDPKAEYWAACKADFEQAVELNPGYDVSWFYLANGAFAWGNSLAGAGSTQDAASVYRYAAKAWGRYLSGNGGNAQRNSLAGMGEGAAGFLAQIKWFSGKAWEGRDAESAIAIAKWVTEASPSDAEAWNNLAFFYRDTGQAALSLQAYEQALKLQPEHPQVMNDLAVILHYYLKKDDDRARGLYEEAIDRAEAMLAGELSEDERGLIQVALRDAKRNLGKLNSGNRVNN